MPAFLKKKICFTWQDIKRDIIQRLVTSIELWWLHIVKWNHEMRMSDQSNKKQETKWSLRCKPGVTYLGDQVLAPGQDLCTEQHSGSDLPLIEPFFDGKKTSNQNQNLKN